MSVRHPVHSINHNPNRTVVRTPQPTAHAARPVRPPPPKLPSCANMYGSVNEDVVIRLKWGQTEYKGRLISVDSYMNVQLSNTEEFIDGKTTGTLGQVLIR